MLEDEADEGVIERRPLERQGEKVGLDETDVRQPGIGDPPPGEADGAGRDVHGHETRFRAAAGEGDGLGADATADLEDDAPRWVHGPRVEQFDKRAGLIVQALLLEPPVTVNVPAGRCGLAGGADHVSHPGRTRPVS